MTAIGISDEDTKYPVREDDTRSIQTTPLDKNFSDTLSKMVSRLCSICGNFFNGQSKIKLKSQQQDFSRAKVYHTSLLSLEESVKSGCPLCQDLSKTFEKRLKWDPVLQRFTARSSSIWCNIEPCEWEKLPRYGLIQEKRIRGLRMLFHARDQYGRELHANCIGGLTFFPPGILGIGPEFRGKKQASYLAMVTWSNCCRSRSERNYGRLCKKHRLGSILVQRLSET